MKTIMNRRGFGRVVAGFAAAALATPGLVPAADLPPVDEADAQAKALGYVADASKADKAKFTNFVEGSTCASCALYQGPADGVGPCAIFPGKTVAANGWCSAFAKKPA